MSVALFGKTIFGTVKHKGVKYKLLNFPTDKKAMKKISMYREKLKNPVYSTAPWGDIIYVFEIIDYRLYLTFIHCKEIAEEYTSNEVVKIFSIDRKEINYTGTLQVFSRSKDVIENAGIRAWFYVVELEFERGILQGVKNVQWKKSAGRILQNYIPE